MKSYELTDHLGNVRVVLSDLKKLDNNVLKSEVLAAYEYYPFGMILQKIEPSNGYRYKFNGKEMDDEGMGGGSSTYDYGFRIYNPALARFLSIDPLTKNYPSWSPYPFAMNRCIDGIDIDGTEYESNDSESLMREYGLMPDQIWNNAINGLDNIFITGYEWTVTDNQEGKLIRKKLTQQGVSLGDVTNEQLGIIFKIRFTNRTPDVELESGVGDDLIGLGFSIVDVAGLLSPAKTTGLLSKFPTTTVLGQLRHLTGSDKLTKKAADLLILAKDFNNKTFNVGGSRHLLLDKAAFTHILGRHDKTHFFEESRTLVQSFFKDGTTPDQVVDLVEKFVKKYNNQIEDIMSGKSKKTFVQGEIDGQKFQLGLREDRTSIGQFTPLE